MTCHQDGQRPLDPGSPNLSYSSDVGKRSIDLENWTDWVRTENFEVPIHEKGSGVSNPLSVKI